LHKTEHKQQLLHQKLLQWRSGSDIRNLRCGAMYNRSIKQSL